MDSKMINVIVPMAGAGTRMKDPLPKFMMNARGKPMLQRMLESLSLPDANYVFVIRDDYNVQGVSDWIINHTEIHKGNKQIVIVQQTNGPAETAYLATPWIDLSERLIIADCDNFFCLSREISGFSNNFVLCHKHTGNDGKYSYVKVQDDSIGIELTKDYQPTGIASAGVYGWSRGEIFVQCIQGVYKNPQPEILMTEVYQYLPLLGMNFNYYMVENYHNLGNKEDLERFNAYEEYVQTILKGIDTNAANG